MSVRVTDSDPVDCMERESLKLREVDRSFVGSLDIESLLLLLAETVFVLATAQMEGDSKQKRRATTIVWRIGQSGQKKKSGGNRKREKMEALSSNGTVLKIKERKQRNESAPL